MNILKRFLSILLTIAFSLSAWAIDQDADGYYLIGSVQDWKDFATLVQTTPASYNAKLTTDVDLGSEQTMLGSIEQPYSGTFDGQGFTLTVHLNNTVDGVAPFRRIDNTTIKNLAVAGSVTGDIHSSGLVGGVPENSEYNLISNVMVSTTITTTGSHCGGILGHGGSTTNTTIQDCLFNGTINGKSGGSTVGVIWGWQTYGQANITNCLENGTYTNTSSFNPVFLTASGPANVANTYYVTGSSSYGTQATSESLADGTVTDALNNGRTGDDAPWIQDPVTNQPMLKIFASLKQDAEGYYLIGSVQDWDNFATLVNNGNTTANAKMTADIDLGDDQTVIGNPVVSTAAYSIGSGNHFKGIFDGQGHTLTVAYNATGNNSASPFSSIEDATIKNLHVDGTMVSPKACGAGIASATGGTGNLIENVWVSVSITANGQDWNCSSGIVGCVKNGSVTIKDCLFTGSVTCSQSHNGCFVGYIDSGSATVSNCLSTGSFNYTGSSIDFYGTHTNCYVKQFPSGVTANMQCTEENLEDGSIAYKLQQGRVGLVWGQRIGIDDEPVLTNDESYRVYRSINGGYTNDPDLDADLKQDADGYYLLGSVQDWKDFAALVETTPTANAKMTADINLGDDQTRIGDTREVEDGYFFEGVFDGQGHTLTIAYNYTDTQATSDPQAPFTHIKGATIKNLHVDGTVATSHGHSAIVAWVRGGTNVISNVWSSLKTTTSRSGWDECSAIVSWIGHATVTIQDCLFTGSITGTNGTSYNGCFIGWCQYSDDNTKVLNCLSTGTFTNIGSCDPTRGRTHTNSFIKQFPTSIPENMQCTPEALADGSIAYKLQQGRVGLVWGQRIGIDDEPVLTNDESYRVYRSINGGYTNDPDLDADLKQDADGYYLLGSVQDWDNFATLVETTPTANAKMTADIDLGDDQTMIGSGTRWSDAGELNHHYKGIFDGQGHTLTINYNTSEVFTAPFRHISGATIKNLHVTGTITTNSTIAASIAASCSGISIDSYITNCVSSVNIISNYVNTGRPLYDGARHGGFVGQLFNKARINFNDCVFNGSITGENQNVLWGGFVGLCDGTVRVTNCLQSATFECSNVVSGNTATFATIFGNDISITNGYYLNQLGVAQGTQATAEQLANGTIATALQNGRDEEIWVQDRALNQPMLKLFASESGISTGEVIQVPSYKLQVTSESWCTIDGRKLSGKPSAKGIYIHNGNKMIVK